MKEGKLLNLNPLLLRNWIKKFINASTNKFIKLIPELEKTTKTAKLTEEIFSHLMRNMTRQPKRYYKDKNFPRFLEVARKTIILLTVTDNHYEQWLAYFYIEAMLKMNRIYETWIKLNPNGTFQDFADWFTETGICEK